MVGTSPSKFKFVPGSSNVSSQPPTVEEVGNTFKVAIVSVAEANILPVASAVNVPLEVEIDDTLLPAKSMPKLCFVPEKPELAVSIAVKVPLRDLSEFTVTRTSERSSSTNRYCKPFVGSCTFCINAPLEPCCSCCACRGAERARTPRHIATATMSNETIEHKLML